MSQFRIQSLSRFIHNDELRILDQHICQAKTLTHPAGKRAYPLIDDVSQADPLERGLDPAFNSSREIPFSLAI